MLSPRALSCVNYTNDVVPTVAFCPRRRCRLWNEAETLCTSYRPSCQALAKILLILKLQTLRAVVLIVHFEYQIRLLRIIRHSVSNKLRKSRAWLVCAIQSRSANPRSRSTSALHVENHMLFTLPSVIAPCGEVTLRTEVSCLCAPTTTSLQLWLIARALAQPPPRGRQSTVVFLNYNFVSFSMRLVTSAQWRSIPTLLLSAFSLVVLNLKKKKKKLFHYTPQTFSHREKIAPKKLDG